MTPFDYETTFVAIQFPVVDGVVADNFLKVKETLTRIGIPANDRDHPGERVLWQSCHILHKRQKYFLVHFLEMFLLDGKFEKTTITENDLARRNAIALLLEQWGLVTIVDPRRTQTPPPAPVASIKIIPFREKENWRLKSKYEIGKPRGNR